MSERNYSLEKVGTYTGDFSGLSECLGSLLITQQLGNSVVYHTRLERGGNTYRFMMIHRPDAIKDNLVYSIQGQGKRQPEMISSFLEQMLGFESRTITEDDIPAIRESWDCPEYVG